MSLGFLTPTAAGEGPPAESPMAEVAAAGGARLDVRDGWRVPVSFGDGARERAALAESVAFADASALVKTQLSGPADALAACAGGLTFGTATRSDGAWWCPLTPARALVLGPAPATPPDGVDALDVTTQLCALRIGGPQAGALLARFCALDLRPALSPPGALRPGSVARTPGTVIVEAPDRFLVLVGAALAEYFWTVVADAAARLGGRPVGCGELGGPAVNREEAITNA